MGDENNRLALADQIVMNSPIGITVTKQSMWLNANAGSLEAAIQKRKAFVEKRRPQFSGC